MSIRRIGWLVVAGLVLLPATAGTIRHDRLDSQYTALATLYPTVGKLTGGGILCSGTLIDPEWVLTAAHCSPIGLGGTFDLGGGLTRTVSQIIVHPNWNGDLTTGWDIALFKLNSAINTVTPSALYATTDEVGWVGVNVGYGKTGDGLTGDVGAAGTKRAGENVIDATGAAWAWSSRILLSDFDSPTAAQPGGLGSATPLNLEYNIAPGDSGGGLFIGSMVAGVHSFLAWVDGTGNADYGDFSGSTRVSSFTSWIRDFVPVRQPPAPSVPEPGTLALLAGGLVIVRRRRKQ